MRVVVVPADAAERVAEAVPGARVLELPQFETVQRLVESFMPPAGVVSSVVAEQARRNAAARAEFLSEFEALDAEGVADLAGSKAGNRRATASRWQGEGLCFAVEHEGRLVFPAFQFDPATGRPRAAVAEVIAALRSVGLGVWSLALWWATPADVLAWRRPADVLSDEPDRVIDAARVDARTRG
jgi:hypothetical protein